MSPLCILYMLVPQVIPLLTLMLVEESTPAPILPLNASGASLSTPWIVTGIGYGDENFGGHWNSDLGIDEWVRFHPPVTRCLLS
jgi:hypothetical protein